MTGGLGYVGKYTNRDEEIAAARLAEETAAQWGNLNGTITRVHSDGSIDIKPDYKLAGPDGPLEIPELLTVPLNHMRSGRGALIVPPKVGDKVRMSPMMRSTENFHTGEEWTPSDVRMNALSDMEATLIGGEPLTDPIENYDPDNVDLRFNKSGTYGIKGSEDGKIAINGAQGNIYELVSDAVDLCRQGFELLGTEATLTHTASYTTIGAQLAAIVAKLEAMKL